MKVIEVQKTKSHQAYKYWWSMCWKTFWVYTLDCIKWSDTFQRIVKNQKCTFKRKIKHWKVWRLATYKQHEGKKWKYQNILEKRSKGMACSWRCFRKYWKLIEDPKDLSFVEKEILISEQLNSDSKLKNLAKSTEMKIGIGTKYMKK